MVSKKYIATVTGCGLDRSILLNLTRNEYNGLEKFIEAYNNVPESMKGIEEPVIELHNVHGFLSLG